MNNKKHPFIFILNVLIFSLIILLHYTDKTAIQIEGATALLVLPLLTAYSLFHSPLRCAIVGLCTGVFMDACTVGSYCFNAITLMVLATLVSVTSNVLFNKNIRSAIVFSLITSGVYHIANWAVFHTFGETFSNSLAFLLRYAAPSALFSAVFIFPFYFLYRYFHKITS